MTNTPQQPEYIITEAMIRRLEMYDDFNPAELRSRPAPSQELSVGMVAAYEQGLKEGAAQAREEVLEPGLLYDLIYWAILFRDKNCILPTGIEARTHIEESLHAGGEQR